MIRSRRTTAHLRNLFSDKEKGENKKCKKAKVDDHDRSYKVSAVHFNMHLRYNNINHNMFILSVV